MPVDPLLRFRRWFDEARRARIALPEAMALGTADRTGRPSVRFVLLKQADARGFVFFTDARSRKGRELRENPRASLALYWDPIGKQVRVEGRTEGVAAADVDRYWQTRPRESRLAALSSTQSARLTARSELLAVWRKFDRHYPGERVPRPPYWTGFRVVPDRIEFWRHRDHRLHERELFVRTRRGWSRTLLQP
jgi:pyridoxamine 5'-phosphate oxidase